LGLADSVNPFITLVDLNVCVTDDTAGKIGKAQEKLQTAIDASCAGVPMLFNGGYCSGLTGTALGTCIGTRALCQACLTEKGSDQLIPMDCDALDDGLDNSSCANL